MTAERSLYVSHTTCMHGIDAGNIKQHNDDKHNAIYLYLDPNDNVSIRIDLKYGDLEQDRKGLRALAKMATQIAQEIETIQHFGDKQ